MEKVKKYPTLYKLDSKGKIRVYYLGVTPEGVVVNHSGVNGGKLVKSKKAYTNTKLKTGYEKAITAANLKHKKKQESGYTTDNSGIGPIVWKPVLLHKFSKHSEKIDYPCISMPKLDGVRATWREQKLWTRGLKEYKTGVISHIADALISSYGWGRLDGEIYGHGIALQDIVHGTRTYDSSITPFLKFYIFDCPDNPGYPLREVYKTRLQKLLKISKDFKGLPIEMVKAHVCACKEDVDQWYKHYLDQGYEGLIIRNMNGIYEWNGRSYDIQKKKDKLSKEFEIVSYKENSSTGRRLLEFVCRTSAMGTRFTVVPAWTKDRRDLSKPDVIVDAQDSIGCKLQCEFRYWTKDGLPGHCVGKVVRPEDDL